jgi:hypothetical protein
MRGPMQVLDGDCLVLFVKELRNVTKYYWKGVANLALFRPLHRTNNAP